MARINFLALAAAMVLAMVTLPQSSTANNLAAVPAAAPELASRAAAAASTFDPLNDPDIEILDDVEDTDFDDLPGFADDDDNDNLVDGVSGAANLTRRRKHRNSKHRNAAHKHKKHTHRHSHAKLHVSAAPDVGAKLIAKNYWVTWYSSHDLLNPACGAGKWQPSKRSHVAAISGKSHLKCGDFLQLCVTNKKSCVKVRIVDACPGCKVAQHVDLSKAAFLQLATGGLDQGEVHDVHSYDLGQKISPWSINLFGGKLQAQGSHPF